MATVRAKFKCTERTNTEQGDRFILVPVMQGSYENEEFFKWTPFGKLEMGILNPEAANKFEVGKEYYIDFIPAN